MTSRLADGALRAFAHICAPGGRDGRLAILIYHRVLGGADELNDWDVTATQFEAQMTALRSQFNPLPLSEALDRLRRGDLPARAVSVTFDDGYADNAQVATPILRRCEVPATFFIATGFLNGGRMWNDRVVDAVREWAEPTMDLGWGQIAMRTVADRRLAIMQILQRWKHLPTAERDAMVAALPPGAGSGPSTSAMMTDGQVRELRAAGMEIGAHTVSHPILRLLPDHEAVAQIAGSRDYLADLLREPISLFAYPNGKPGIDYGPREVAAVRSAGFRAAVSTASGVADARSSAFELPRFTPWDRAPWRYSLRLAANFRHAVPPTVESGTAPDARI